MKILFTLSIVFAFTISVFAQAPDKMSYQAVIRNSNDQLVTDQQVGMQISILQGVVSGTAVYVETQKPITNTNGLISIEIGDGTVKSGDFSSIDWTNGPYFIKTETDPVGGTSYTITGTSQLLSVPYALHAKTAENVTGTITETDPTFASSQAANIAADDITNLGNLSGVNTGDQDLSTLATKTALGDSTTQLRGEIPVAADGSETKLTAGSNITIAGSGTQASPYEISANGGNSTRYVGELYDGGIVFYVDHTGGHGLIASLDDLDGGGGVAWSATQSTEIGASAQSWTDGASNTAAIVAQDGTAGYAATLCNEYRGGGYTDWYLPSNRELYLLASQDILINNILDNDGEPNTNGFKQRYVVPTYGYYWSSTEGGSTGASTYRFTFGYENSGPKSGTYRVRAIRAF